MDSQTGQEIKKRLIVLLPVSMANDFELAHMIHWMAFQKNCDVVYMTIAESDDESLALSREMATMKAVTGGNLLNAQWIQASPTDWLTRLREIYQPEDELMYNEEQTTGDAFLRKVKLQNFGKELTADEIHLASELYPTQEVKEKRGIPGLLSLLGFLAIIALFTFLQIRVDGAIQGTPGTVILLVLLCVEFGAMWVWNNLTFT